VSTSETATFSDMCLLASLTLPLGVGVRVRVRVSVRVRVPGRGYNSKVMPYILNCFCS